MKSITVFIALLVLVTLLSTESVRAEFPKLPVWNPFKKKDASVARQVRPRTARPPQPRPSVRPVGFDEPVEPGMVEKVSGGTKKFFASTAEFLTPWNKDSDSRTARQTSTAGSNPANKPTTNRATTRRGRIPTSRARSPFSVKRRSNSTQSNDQPRKPPFFVSWFKRDKPEPEQPESISDWMSLPRPE